ncbi:MAG: PDZ domain-containing protein, partial [Pyrinomonadaceae bacterium]
IGQTVTMGIISAKSRRTQLGDGDFEDFIQTDAPINRGNSGGALVNTSGELIGINSQILSPSGGSIGIGFAIPTNMARSVMEQLIKTGAVRRGLLGVTTRNVDSETATSLSIPQVRGALVTETQQDSAAERAGLKPYDVIIGVNGNPVGDNNSLKNQIAAIQPGSNVTLTIIRNGKEQKLNAILGEHKSEVASATGTAILPGGSSSESSKLRGVRLEEIRPEIAAQLNMSRDTQGVIVTGLDPSSPAAQSGLAERDVITEVNRKPIRSIGDLNATVNASGDRPLLLMVKRPTQGGPQSLILTLDARS